MISNHLAAYRTVQSNTVLSFMRSPFNEEPRGDLTRVLSAYRLHRDGVGVGGGGGGRGVPKGLKSQRFSILDPRSSILDPT